MSSGDRIFLLCLFTFVALFISGYVSNSLLMQWAGIVCQLVAIAIFVILEREEKGR